MMPRTCTSLVGKKTPSLLLRFSDGGPPLNPAHRQLRRVDAFCFRFAWPCLALLQAVVSSEGRITWRTQRQRPLHHAAFVCSLNLVEADCAVRRVRLGRDQFF